VKTKLGAKSNCETGLNERFSKCFCKPDAWELKDLRVAQLAELMTTDVVAAAAAAACCCLLLPAAACCCQLLLPAAAASCGCCGCKVRGGMGLTED
jgi:hypothetical protein